MDINCKEKCKTDCDAEPNCQWVGGKRCQRRAGVLNGIRYTFKDGKIVPIGKNCFTFDFEYDPYFDKETEPIDRRTFGKGTYGITFFPALDCIDGTMYSKKIGKVFASAESAHVEWNSMKFLKDEVQKGTTQKYFTYPTAQCEVPLKTCGNLTKSEQELYDFVKDALGESEPLPKKLVQHLMDFSGMTLPEYIKYYYSAKTLGRAELVHILANLFYGIKRLNGLGYIHQDIKGPNIVISNTKRLRIIDFGLTVKMFNENGEYIYTNKDDNYIIHTYYHGVSAPENAIFKKAIAGLLFKNVTVKEQILKPSEVFGWVDKVLQPWYFYFFKKNGAETDEETKIIIEKDINDFIVDLINKTEHRSINSLSEYWKKNEIALKSDLYGIGMVLLRIAVQGVLKSHSDEDPEVNILFRKLGRGLLTFNPKERLSTLDAIKLVEQILEFPHDDPFKKNVDPPEIKRCVSFGKNLNELRRLIEYLK